MNELENCPDCNASPGQTHKSGCDVERCSVCAMQRLQCEGTKQCRKHDRLFARWTGLWPGEAEAQFLGIDLNTFSGSVREIFFIKPTK